MRQMSPLYASVFVASMLFPALATIFKEKIFTDAKQKLGGKQLDIFVVRALVALPLQGHSWCLQTARHHCRNRPH